MLPLFSLKMAFVIIHPCSLSPNLSLYTAFFLLFGSPVQFCSFMLTLMQTHLFIPYLSLTNRRDPIDRVRDLSTGISIGSANEKMKSIYKQEALHVTIQSQPGAG
jgi:hypothetical protein